MSEREPPKPGERWRHYKLENNKRYIANIVGIAQYSVIYFKSHEKLVIYGNFIDIIYELAKSSTFVAKHTETKELFDIRKEGNQWWLCPLIDFITDKPITREPIAWLRPLDNFMDSVMVGGDNKDKMVYRFERVDTPDDNNDCTVVIEQGEALNRTPPAPPEQTTR